MEAFAAGGATGLVYQVLLQQTIDSIPGSSDYRQPPAKRLQRFLGSPVFRISFLGAAILCGLQARAPAHVSIAASAPASHPIKCRSLVPQSIWTDSRSHLWVRIALISLRVKVMSPFQQRAVGTRDGRLLLLTARPHRASPL